MPTAGNDDGDLSWSDAALDCGVFKCGLTVNAEVICCLNISVDTTALRGGGLVPKMHWAYHREMSSEAEEHGITE